MVAAWGKAVKFTEQTHAIVRVFSHYPVTIRLCCGAMAAWLVSVWAHSYLVWGTVFVLVVSTLVFFSTSSVQSRQFTRLLLSIVIFASAAGAMAGASAMRARTVPPEFFGNAQVVSDPVTLESGFHRARAVTELGELTLLSRTKLPPAGTRISVRAQTQRQASEVSAFVTELNVMAQPQPWWQLRAQLRQHLRSVAGDGHAGARLLPGLVVGDTTGIDEKLAADMKAVSLTHITAVSGANISLVGLSVIALMRWLSSRRWLGLSLAVAASAVYVFIVGPDPSVIRAAGMGLASVVVMARGQGRSGVGIVAAAVMILLIIRPDLATAVGFQLSVSATLAIVMMSYPLSLVLQRYGLGFYLSTLIAVPITAQLGVLPIMVAHGNAPGAWSIIVNILAAPMVGPATILGLVSMCTYPFVVVGTIIALPGGWCAWWITALAHTGASLPGSYVAWVSGTLGILLALLVTICAGIALAAKKPYRAYVAGLGVLALCGGAVVPLLRTSPPSDWVVMICDVGQGSASLVNLGQRHVALIDTGNKPDLLQTCLNQAKVRTVSLFISHFDSDHFGAVHAINQAGRTVDGWYITAAEAADPKVESATTALKVAPQILDAGAHLQAGNVTFEVLWPPAGATLESNAASMVIRATIPMTNGSLTVLFPGDLGQEQQRQLTTISPVDVLVAPHHGSRDLDPGFFHAASAQLGVVSVGENNYGHPSVHALQAFGTAPVLRTDHCGSLVISSRGSVAGNNRGCISHIRQG